MISNYFNSEYNMQKANFPNCVSALKYLTVVYVLFETIYLQHTVCKKMEGLGDGVRLQMSVYCLMQRHLLCLGAEGTLT